LLHRAIWQAQEVFRSGVEAYPKSESMLTGWALPFSLEQSMTTL